MSASIDRRRIRRVALRARASVLAASRERQPAGLRPTVVPAPERTAARGGSAPRLPVPRRPRPLAADRGTPPAGPAGLVVRPLRPDEPDVVDAVFEGMSMRSRYLRFHAPVRQLPPRYRQVLTDVDGRDRIALVAELPPADVSAGGTADGTGGPARRPVGIARLIRTGPEQAEVAVSVVDAAHRRGVARALLTALDERATALGLRQLHAYVLAENTGALALFRSVFAQGPAVFEGDAIRLTCLPGTVRRAAGTAAARPAGGPDRGFGISSEDLLADLLA